MTDPLDNVVWHSLAGPHRRFAEDGGRARRFDPEVAVFAALPAEPEAADWDDLRRLVGSDRSALLRPTVPVPDGWTVAMRIPVLQMVCRDGAGRRFEEAERLGPDDVVDMLDLVARTQPGPFARRTIELGTYLGVRRDGRLVAMAGERMALDGQHEISAVCTDEDHQGQGLAGALVEHLIAENRAAGRDVFLHATATNLAAVRLYEALGFAGRRDVEAIVLEPPS